MGTMSATEIGYRIGAKRALHAYTLRCAFLESPIDPNIPRTIEDGAKAKFPISASDLSDRFEGKALGDALRECEANWIASGFSLTRDQLLG